MPIKQDLEDTFRVHEEEASRCLDNDCSFALFHLLCALPAICAALQEKDGKTNTTKQDSRRTDSLCYREWCDSYFNDSVLTSGELYGLRCGLLHEGKPRAFTLGGRGAEHGARDNIGQTIVAVASLNDGIWRAVAAWKNAVVEGTVTDYCKAPAQAFVEKNLPNLVRLVSATGPFSPMSR